MHGNCYSLADPVTIVAITIRDTHMDEKSRLCCWKLCPWLPGLMIMYCSNDVAKLKSYNREQHMHALKIYI